MATDYGQLWSNSFNQGYGLARQADQDREAAEEKRNKKELAKRNAAIARTREKDEEYTYTHGSEGRVNVGSDPLAIKMMEEDTANFGDFGARTFEGRYGLGNGAVTAARNEQMRINPDVRTYPLGANPADGLNVYSKQRPDKVGNYTVESLDNIEFGSRAPSVVAKPVPNSGLDIADPGVTYGLNKDASQSYRKEEQRTGTRKVTEDVPLSEQYRQMAKNAADLGQPDKADEYMYRADMMAKQEVTEKREGLRFDNEQKTWGRQAAAEERAIESHKLQVEQTRQSIELNGYSLSKAQREEIVRGKLDELSVAVTKGWDGIKGLADPDKNDGIDITYKDVKGGKVAMYGGMPLFEGRAFKSAADMATAITGAIKGDPDFYAEHTWKMEQRDLERRKTESEITYKDSMGRAALTTAGRSGTSSADYVKALLPQVRAERVQAKALFDTTIQNAGGDPKKIKVAQDQYNAALAEIDEYYASYGARAPQAGASFEPPPRPTVAPTGGPKKDGPPKAVVPDNSDRVQAISKLEAKYGRGKIPRSEFFDWTGNLHDWATPEDVPSRHTPSPLFRGLGK